MFEGTARQLGDFIGQFVKYDAAAITRGLKKFLRVRVKLDVRRLLKRKKRMAIDPNEKTYALFQNENL